MLCAGAGGTTWLCEELSTQELWALKMFKLPLPPHLVRVHGGGGGGGGEAEEGEMGGGGRKIGRAHV